MKFILGTGRSGTKSAAAHYNAEHEVQSELIIPLATHLSSGFFTAEETAEQISQFGLPEVSVHYRYAELVVPLMMVYPYAKFLWVRRDKTATVQSMVRRGWYHPNGDQLWPVQTLYWIYDEGPKLFVDYNHAAYRLTPVMLGELAWNDWKDWPQVVRCVWWVNHCTKLIEQTIDRFPDKFLDTIDLEYTGWPIAGE